MLEWTLPIVIHAVVATAAVVLGGFNLLRRKKGDALHKTIGRTWVVLMLITSCSAFFIGGYDSLVSVALHGLAAWTIISIISGVYFAKKGNIRAHRAFMSGSYFGLIGALIGVIAVPSRRIPSWFEAYPVQMSVVALTIILVAWLLIHFFSRTQNDKSSL